MIYVTHDQIEAMTLADRIAVMKERRHPAARLAAGDLQPAGQPVRRRLHRLAGDELHRGGSSQRRAESRVFRPTGSAVPLDGYAFDMAAVRAAGGARHPPGAHCIRTGCDRRSLSRGGRSRDRRTDGLRHLVWTNVGGQNLAVRPTNREHARRRERVDDRLRSSPRSASLFDARNRRSPLNPSTDGQSNRELVISALQRPQFSTARGQRPKTLAGLGYDARSSPFGGVFTTIRRASRRTRRVRSLNADRAFLDRPSRRTISPRPTARSPRRSASRRSSAPIFTPSSGRRMSPAGRRLARVWRNARRTARRRGLKPLPGTITISSSSACRRLAADRPSRSAQPGVMLEAGRRLGRPRRCDPTDRDREHSRGKVAALHVKDIAPAGRHGRGRLGRCRRTAPSTGEGCGRRSRQTGVKPPRVEHDNPSDWRRFAGAFLRYAAKLTGRSS